MNTKSIIRHGLTWIIGLIFLASALAAADSQHFIRVGGSAESIYDARITDIEILISLIFNEKFKDQDSQIRIKIYESDLSLSNQLLSGNIDASFMNPVFYLDHIEHLNSDYTYAIQHGPNKKVKYILLTRRDSDLSSLEALRDKKLIVPSGHLVGRRYLDVELLRANLPVADEFFSEIRYTGETDSAIINLFFGQVDAALVTDFSYEVASELNRQIPQALQIIHTSAPLIHMLISIHKDFSPQLADKFLPFIDTINDSPRLQHLRKTFRLAGVKKIEPGDLHDLELLNQEYSTLMKKSSSQ
ncbi:MAG: PhnD/SsuA/transferrin family substrate-binding protein [Candidatus Thiodiazotropha sp.]